VRFRGHALPAELAVLSRQLRSGEQGAWLNSRSTRTGVETLLRSEEGYKTKRIELPAFVVTALKRVYSVGKLTKGCPDLVIWHAARRRMRLVEVKCPDWDRMGADQLRFRAVARKARIPSQVVEWRFLSSAV
jgi:VRR-NUC domain-containing protein